MGVWAEEWSKAIQQDIAWDTDNPEQMQADGLRMLMHPEVRKCIDSMQPLVENGEPVIEKYVELRVPDVPVPVVGYIDLIAEDGVPVDLKTSAKAWTQDQADREVQPLFYLAALNQQGYTANLSYRFRHVVFVKTKVPQVQVIESRRSAGALLWLAGVISQVWRGIERDVFPCNPASWRCSARFCDYHHLCRGKV